MRRVIVGFALCGAACRPQPSATHGASEPVEASAHAEAAAIADASFGDAAPEKVSNAADPPEPKFEEILEVLFPVRTTATEVASQCGSLAGEARVRCVYEKRYAGDARALGVAFDLYTRWKVVVGVEEAHTMNGGYRGMIRIEPQVPILAECKHLEWVAQAMHDFDGFFAELDAYGRTHASAAGKVATARPYRFRPITLRFMRSVAARTPSAYAHDWTVAYNVAGSLFVSADAARETMFHEIFHLNDAARDSWSTAALGQIFDGIVKKCGTSIPCLAPFSPNETIVRGGTYYSFQPGNGVVEYAAELALRYYREQRAALRNISPKPTRFKCGPAENRRAWEAMRDRFFGGVDATPSCS